MTSVVRTIEAYSIHGFESPGSSEESLLNYSHFFDQLAAAKLQTLRIQISEDVVAITDQQWASGKLALRLVSGNPEEIALFYDIETAKEVPGPSSDKRFAVRGVWVFVVPKERLVFVERKRPGVPIFQIERFLSGFGRDQLGLKGLTISLNPVVSESFANEVKSFTRIREASVVVRRPNHSWARAAENLLGPAANSNAAQVEIQLNADRGQSLIKDGGLVGELIQIASNPISAVKNAVVRGLTPSFDGERTVSLKKHTVKGSARLDRGASADEHRDTLARVVDDLTLNILSHSDQEREDLNEDGGADG